MTPEKKKRDLDRAIAWQVMNHPRYLLSRRRWWARNRAAIKIVRTLRVPIAEARAIVAAGRRQ